MSTFNDQSETNNNTTNITSLSENNKATSMSTSPDKAVDMNSSENLLSLTSSSRSSMAPLHPEHNVDTATLENSKHSTASSFEQQTSTNIDTSSSYSSGSVTSVVPMDTDSTTPAPFGTNVTATNKETGGSNAPIDSTSSSAVAAGIDGANVGAMPALDVSVVASTHAGAAPNDWSPPGGNGAAPARKKGWPRGRKRRCLPRDAPKGPLSGYMLYMAEQRELLRQSENPPSFTELAKLVAHKWASLEVGDKQKYLDRADLEKERYQKELDEYVKTDSYKQFVEQQKNLANQQMNSAASASSPPNTNSVVPTNSSSTNNSTAINNTNQSNTPNVSSTNDSKRPKKDYVPNNVSPASRHVNGSVNNTNNINGQLNGLGSNSTNGLDKSNDEDDLVNINNNSPLEIPIFTDQFLKHNKAREAELRKLRKTNSDYEEQNALLQKHIESIRLSVEKYERETTDLKDKTDALSKHLSSLRADLTKAFQNTPAPGWAKPPTIDNIDDYLMSLHACLTASPPATQSRAMQQAVQQIVCNLMLH